MRLKIACNCQNKNSPEPPDSNQPAGVT